jgi:ABC-2 type transport system permease protein
MNSLSLRRAWLVVWKEFLELLRDRSLISIVFVMPLIQLLLFGYVVSTDVKNIDTAIVDSDHTVASQQVGDSLLNSGFFTLAGRVGGMADAQRLMDANKAQVIVRIPSGFSQALAEGKKSPVQVIVDGTDPTTGQVASMYASNILGNLSRKLTGTSGMGGSGPGVDAQVRVWFNPTLRSMNTMIPGLLSTILFMMVVNLVSATVVKERERGTLEQIFVTPLNSWQYLLGKMVPYVVVAFIQFTTVFTAGVLWFHVPFRGNFGFMMAAAALFLFTSIGIGLIVSTLAQTRQQAQQVSAFISLPVMMLSGYMFPISAMPAPVQWISAIIPLRYFLVVIRGIFLKGIGPEALLPQLGAMAAFSIVIFGFAIMRFQKKIAD